MTRYSNKKKIYRNWLIIVLLLIGLGYAYLQADLKINGDALFKRSTWNIHWYNVSVSQGSVSGTSVTQAAQITGTNSDTVEYSVTLTNPRDYYEFTVDAKNEGTIDGMISVVSNKVYSGTTEITMPNYVGYTVTYEDGVTVAPNHLLSAGSSETYKVKVYFKDDIEASELPSADTSLSFKFNVTYVQANGSEIDPRGYNDDLYDDYIYSVNDNVDIYIGQALPNGITTYNTYEDLMNNTTRKTFLRYKLTNDVVSEAYIGIVKDNKVYIFQGGVDESALTSQPIYERNLEIGKSFLGENNCGICDINNDCSVEHYVCHDEIVWLNIHKNGFLEFFVDNRVPVIDAITDDGRTGLYTS